MSDKITLSPAGGTVVVRAGGAIIAETTGALRLAEGGHDDVFYIPREDVGMAFLEPSDRRTTCPQKGEATHYHVVSKSGPIENAAWSYEDPVPDMAQIRGMIAFYPEKAAVEEL